MEFSTVERVANGELYTTVEHVIRTGNFFWDPTCQGEDGTELLVVTSGVKRTDGENEIPSFLLRIGFVVLLTLKDDLFTHCPCFID